MRAVVILALGLGAVPGAHGAASDHGLTAGGADTCLGCHNDASMRVIFRTAHGRKADPASPMASLQCETCHGPGAEHSDRRIAGRVHPAIVDFGMDSTTSAAAQNAVCEGCHERDVGLAWHGSVHERNDATCVSCHTVHTERDPVSLQAAQAGVCFDCHRAVRADTMKPSTHPIRFDAMTCTDCHAPHGAQAPALLTAPTTSELCLGCHAEYRGPMLFDHPPVSEDCGLCHTAHGSIHPALLVRREPLLCQSCHSRRGHPSLSFTDDGLAGGRPSAMLLGQSCSNCHVRVHGSNHPSGFSLMR